MNLGIRDLAWKDLYRRAYQAPNYYLRTMAGGKLADHCLPTDISILMTNLCNAKCVHCDIWKNKGKDSAPTLAQYQTALSDLRRWIGPVPVCFTGGEALLSKDTVDVVTHSARVGLQTEILTHGYWDDQTRIEKLARANPSRITVSLDGIGETHSKIRGKEKFFEKTTRTLETLKRLRAEEKLGYSIRLKNVIMEHNLDDAQKVAHFAAEHGFEVFFQAVEQNYNTPEDPKWFEHSENWPKDPARAISTVQGLIALKKKGLPIRNSYKQLNVMIPYFLNPDSMRVSVQQHMAHLKHPVCAALTTIQIMPNGDIVTCFGTPPAGNIRETPIREIWKNRPKRWRGGCCLEGRLTSAEVETRGFVKIGPGGGHPDGTPT
jgi:MoaA/NifB/PqqE/SkfB family radical SAM enzyme